MIDYEFIMSRSPDAMKWAEYFVKTTKDMDRDVFRDESYMVGWFANAMMAMHDHLKGETGPLNGDHAQWILDNSDSNQK